ncbi:cytochrome ubiquinol oxidase subunit I [Burkholderia multivorans]|uniref:Cytochrome ubiquinol oxidase n=1 Tax=Burkholderia multivorans CGD2 TaxID=513052 RepID=B9BNM4_9BURK|nr:cytochrome ubiquinol oxidase subunit I [Burkholderia multivorans]AJY15048.1 bacterial Cytochrome Ubiquinol Oxidase family protein [Burkholderia multivorans ATCC BAA-247]AVR20214.1 cytochrome ubiquinol oxidase subunit I [Burkholderia multivorans]EEE07192.1 cytochrome ubiquinol oxidase [Burkholderia multivorans CGD2]EEE13561.1 cytochrome ubiquinol oxidase [Burkholderia multivorans CGD2M]EJO59555.1 bacterial cytochrome ubiquinol oxidase [Burkholderia multivorans ATCC BAA-247]
MDIDALLLSRFQFAWVIAFHILLPAFTVGLSCFIATLEVLHWATRRTVYLRLSTFWLRIFAVSFGMGVVSGIVMPFQFGTNWSRFVAATSNVVGGFMAYEVLTAFFLESAFLGVLLFGRRRVPPWAHAMSAVLVALGTLLSSFWILAVNSWMQTPTGYRIVDGRFYPDSMLSVLLSPSFPFRLAHTVTAFLVTTAFVVLAVGAHYLLQRRAPDESRVMVRMGLWFLTIAVPVQIALGDAHGLNTLAHQPVKLAAMEGLWDTGRGVRATLFAWPDQARETNRFEVSIPRLGSLYLTHDWNGLVHGLKDWPRDQRPSVPVVFFAFHLMVGLGIVMLAIVVRGLTLWRRRRLYAARGWLHACRLAMPIGFLAVLAGWTTTEAGRQPWTVYGLMRTADSVTPSLTTGDVALSFALYAIGYLAIFGAGFVLLRRLVRLGPDTAPAHAGTPGAAVSERPARPLSAVSDSGAQPPGANDDRA